MFTGSYDGTIKVFDCAGIQDETAKKRAEMQKLKEKIARTEVSVQSKVRKQMLTVALSQRLRVTLSSSLFRLFYFILLSLSSHVCLFFHIVPFRFSFSSSTPFIGFSFHFFFYFFLDAFSHLYKRVCPSVGPSVGRSVRRSVRPSHTN